MKKRIMQALALALAALVVVVIYKLGDRRITIYVDGKPAAGRTLTRIPSLESVILDDSGSADLSWGLKENGPDLMFRSEPDRNWTLQLPARGRRTYRIAGAHITTEDTTLDLGVLEISSKVEQRPLSEE